MSKPTIAFCGMTHLGLNSAVAVAERGFSVLCFDADKDLVDAIGKGRIPVNEPDLNDLFAKNADRLSFTANAADLAGCDVAYIAADVPTDDNGESDLSSIRELIDTVAENLNDTSILVVLCQVPPGFTRDLSFPKERLYYQVETLIFGRAVERALNPERYIVGCNDPSILLPDAFNVLLSAFDCPILPMRYESAELAKISINMCLVASVSVANTMAEICEQVGANWSEIVPALKLDRRIGQYSYLNPGLGIAGGNLERDLATVIGLSKAHDTDAGVVAAWVANSRHRKGWAFRTLQNEILDDNPNAAIAVWGLAYKEDTDSTKNSPALALLENLVGNDITAYDPVVLVSDAGNDIKGVSDPLGAVNNADVLLIMTPWAEFRKVSPRDIAKAMRGKTVLDPYRVLDCDDALEAGLDYLTLGVPPMRNER